MSENKSKLTLVMDMVDRITTPIKKVTDATQKSADKIKGTQTQLKKLGELNQDIEHFRKLKKSTLDSNQALTVAKDKVNKLAQEMQKSEKPSQRLTQRFEQASKAVTKLKNKQLQGKQTLNELNEKIKAAGYSTDKLDIATRKIHQDTRKYNTELERQKNQLAKVAAQQKQVNEIKERNKNIRSEALMDGAKIAAVGYGLKKLVNAYGEVATAQGTLKSLGINDDGIAEITQQAKNYSNEFAGTAQAEFIAASYDIKSGIASLSNVAIGEYTRIAALTAGATKSTTDKMTGLFATGYSIYRNQFNQFGSEVISNWDQLSAAERDIKFGEYFSAGIASSVQNFKTDGDKLKQYMQKLGATGTQAKQGFAEQLAIGGMLSASLEGSEAATKYQQFLNNAGKASEDLGIIVHDANGDLLSSFDILSAISEKYGGTLNDLNKQELKDAFGTKEAVDMIDLLLPKLDELDSSTAKVQTDLAGGMNLTSKMAQDILTGPNESFELLMNRMTNLSAAFGLLFAPALMLVSDLLGGAAIYIAEFTERFPMLSKWVGFTIVGLVALKAALIVGRLSFSLYSDALLFAKKVTALFNLTTIKTNAILAATKVKTLATTSAMLVMSGAQKALTATTTMMTGVQWALNTAMLANPIGLIIVGITALVAVGALLITKFEPLTNFFGNLWGGIKSAFVGAWNGITNLLSMNPLELIKTAWSGILDFYSGLWGHIKTGVSTVFNWIIEVILAPINAVKNTLGGIWDSIFGSDNKTVSVDQQIKQVTEPINAANESNFQNTGNKTNSTQSNVIPIKSGASPSKIENSYIIHVHANPGMDTLDIAREVEKILQQKEREAGQMLRARLSD